MTNIRPVPNGVPANKTLKPLVQAIDSLLDDSDRQSFLPELILSDETVARIQKTFTIHPLYSSGTTYDAED